MPRVPRLIVRWCTRRSIRASSSPIGLAFKVDAVARSAVLLVENEALGWLLLGSAGAHKQQTRANGRAQHRNDSDSHYEPRRSHSHGRLALVSLRDSISSTVGGGQPDRRRCGFPEAGDVAVLVWRNARALLRGQIGARVFTPHPEKAPARPRPSYSFCQHRLDWYVTDPDGRRLGDAHKTAGQAQRRARLLSEGVAKNSDQASPGAR